MAGEIQTVLVFTNGESVGVQQSVTEVRELIADAPEGDPSFIRLLNRRGKEHWVNTREIVDFHEPAGKGRAGPPGGA